jgi:hypothetical protein
MTTTIGLNISNNIDDYVIDGVDETKFKVEPIVYKNQHVPDTLESVVSDFQETQKADSNYHNTHMDYTPKHDSILYKHQNDDVSPISDPYITKRHDLNNETQSQNNNGNINTNDTFNTILTSWLENIDNKKLDFKNKIKNHYDNRITENLNIYQTNIKKINKECNENESQFIEHYSDCLENIESTFTTYKNKLNDEQIKNNDTLENYRNTKINELKNKFNQLIYNIDNNIKLDLSW